MDPRLWELQRDGEPAEEIMAIVRLREGAELPPQLTIVTRFGEIATCRLSRRDIATARAHPSVQSLQAPHALVPDVVAVVESGPAAFPLAANDERRPPDLPETGDGVVIGVVDWGCDFTYPSLRNADGTTRLGALWDQSKAYDSGHSNRFG